MQSFTQFFGALCSASIKRHKRDINRFRSENKQFYSDKLQIRNNTSETLFHFPERKWQIREYVYTRRTIHPPIHSRWSNVPCGCCTCLEFLVTQCSVYVVAGFLLSAFEDSPVRCVISSLTLNAILQLSFCTVPHATVSVTTTASLKSY